MPFEPVLTRNFGVEHSTDLRVCQSRGGYQALATALKEYTPAQLVELVKASNLRGRGGAGFAAGVKWSFLPKNHKGPIYLTVNADESEPGTFKDRILMNADPHLLLEGIAITCYAIGCHHAYIYIRGEMPQQAEILSAAIAQCEQAGILGSRVLGSDFSLDVIVHRGAGAYICGEETGLLESLEGKRGWPRIKPPFPAVKGLFGKPTIINNVETICCVPPIVERGADWFNSIGTENSKGPKLFGISGHVNAPGVYEDALGITVEQLIEVHAGGVRDGRRPKAAVPGGISMGLLSVEEFDCPLDFDGPRKYGCLGLGTAGVIVMDDSTDMVKTLCNIARFFAHESCGQCTPCREGTGWMFKVLQRISQGLGKKKDLDLLLEIAGSMGMIPGTTICGLADGAGWPIKNFITKFRPEFEAACVEE